MILEESHPNITICLLEISVPFCRIAEESLTTSGTFPNQDSLRLPQKMLLFLLSSDDSPVPDTFGKKQKRPTKREHSRKGSAALTSSPYKNKLQED